MDPKSRRILGQGSRVLMLKKSSNNLLVGKLRSTKQLQQKDKKNILTKTAQLDASNFKLTNKKKMLTLRFLKNPRRPVSARLKKFQIN